MSPLRKQMEADMAIRGLAYRTRESYVESVAKLAKYYGRGPDRISEAEVQRYLLHLLEERKLAHSSCNVVASALEFFYRTTLKRREAEFCLPRPKVPAKLPQILSREEVALLIEKTTHLKHRALLMTTYGGGLRLLEACRLKVADIDSDRMTIRVEQGKGAKDRYTLLSPRLLAELRRYWLVYRPGLWLFPSKDAEHPISDATVQKIFYAAKDRAGITKQGGIHALRHYAECRVMPSVQWEELGQPGGSRTPCPNRLGIIKGSSRRPSTGRRGDIDPVACAAARSARVPSLSTRGRRPNTSGLFRSTHAPATVR
jgi:integrase/recombinase XerD